MTSRSAYPNVKQEVKSIGYDSVVGSQLVVHGELFSTGSLRVDGIVNNDVKVEGNLLVGETGKITGNLDAPVIEIAGDVKGKITGVKVKITKTGRVVGDVFAMELATESGAYLEGQVVMNDQSEPVSKSIPENPVTPITSPIPFSVTGSTISNAIRAKDKKVI